MKIYDIKDMPGFNPDVANGSDSVTKGLVFLRHWGSSLYPACIKHGAMNKVSSDGIWRCVQLGCNNGCYAK